MNQIIDWTDPLWLALGFAVGMLGAWTVGWRQARRATPDVAPDPGIKFTDAALALLGLLLAFTFSMSLARYDERRTIVVTQSSAIGDFYTCVSLIKEPHRSRLQSLAREYTARQLDAATDLRSEADLQQRLEWFQQAHRQMTALVNEAVDAGTPIAMPLTNALNSVTSTEAAALAAYRARLPLSIVALLFLGAVVPSFLMGLQQGTAARPHVSATVCFMFMVTLVTYVTLDLNQPSHGTITISQEPFRRLLASMDGSPKPPAPSSGKGASSP
jgi:hypothetical protein